MQLLYFVLLISYAGFIRNPLLLAALSYFFKHSLFRLSSVSHHPHLPIKRKIQGQLDTPLQSFKVIFSIFYLKLWWSMASPGFTVLAAKILFNVKRNFDRLKISRPKRSRNINFSV
jgi:hypothetical protein